MDAEESFKVQRGGQPAAVVAAAPGEGDRIARVLEEAGYQVSEPQGAQGEAMELSQECTVEAPRPCELQVVATRIEQLADEAGVAATEVQSLFGGPVTDDQVRQAVDTVIGRMPEGEVRQEAELWRDAAWGEPEA